MSVQRTLLNRWRDLKRWAKHLIVAGILAAGGIIGTAISTPLKEELQGWTKYVIDFGKAYSCERSGARQPLNSKQPVILFPRLGDDPKDEMWSRLIKVLYEETGFDTVPSCLRFESTGTSSINTAREQFLRTI